MKRIKTWLRDWWRGYSDADVMTLLAKLEKGKGMKPGSTIKLTSGEAKALHSGAVMALP